MDQTTTPADDNQKGDFEAWLQTLPDGAPISRLKHDKDLQDAAFCAWFDQELKVRHWKANHDQMVQRLRLLTQRQDLPVERISAYQALIQAQEAVRKLEAVCAAVYVNVAQHGATTAILDVVCDPLAATEAMIEAMDQPEAEDQA